jgi:hypothetical protein
MVKKSENSKNKPEEKSKKAKEASSTKTKEKPEEQKVGTIIQSEDQGEEIKTVS